MNGKGKHKIHGTTFSLMRNYLSGDGLKIGKFNLHIDHPCVLPDESCYANVSVSNIDYNKLSLDSPK